MGGGGGDCWWVGKGSVHLTEGWKHPLRSCAWFVRCVNITWRLVLAEASYPAGHVQVFLFFFGTRHQNSLITVESFLKDRTNLQGVLCKRKTLNFSSVSFSKSKLNVALICLQRQRLGVKQLRAPTLQGVFVFPISVDSWQTHWQSGSDDIRDEPPYTRFSLNFSLLIAGSWAIVAVIATFRGTEGTGRSCDL